MATTLLRADSCGACGSLGAEFCCSRCKAARFCGPECFRKAWKMHKAQCGIKRSVPTSGSSSPGPPATLQSPILEGRIFVSIVAYCDPELPTTLRALLSCAVQPQLLSVGLIWQGEGEPLRESDLQHLSQLWGLDKARAVGENENKRGKLSLPAGHDLQWEGLLGGRIRLVRMPAEDARGPCWARYLAQLLWQGEELYLQIDSHMRFVPEWDRHAREQLLSCAARSAKPVLCSYGRGYPLGVPHDWMPPSELTPCLNCAGFFDDNDVLNIRYRTLNQDWPQPQQSFFWSAHFSFSSSEILRDVPYDPQLLMLFYGEEILMTVRLFTHGWDLFSPSRGLVFHLWEREYRRVYMLDMRKLYAELAHASRRRMHTLLNSGPAPFFE
ncbi:unnamed protein product, partial [Polarella glacialis]